MYKIGSNLYTIHTHLIYTYQQRRSKCTSKLPSEDPIAIYHVHGSAAAAAIAIDYDAATVAIDQRHLIQEDDTERDYWARVDVKHKAEVEVAKVVVKSPTRPLQRSNYRVLIDSYMSFINDSIPIRLDSGPLSLLPYLSLVIVYLKIVLPGLVENLGRVRMCLDEKKSEIRPRMGVPRVICRLIGGKPHVHLCTDMLVRVLEEPLV